LPIVTYRPPFSILHIASGTYITTLSLHDALPICPLDPEARLREQRLHACHRLVVHVGRIPLQQDVAVLQDLEDVPAVRRPGAERSEEHTSELQSRENLVCRLPLAKKNTKRRIS